MWRISLKSLASITAANENILIQIIAYLAYLLHFVKTKLFYWYLYFLVSNPISNKFWNRLSTFIKHAIITSFLYFSPLCCFSFPIVGIHIEIAKTSQTKQHYYHFRPISVEFWNWYSDFFRNILSFSKYFILCNLWIPITFIQDFSPSCILSDISCVS